MSGGGDRPTTGARWRARANGAANRHSRHPRPSSLGICDLGGRWHTVGPVCPVGLPRCARADRCRPAVVSPGVGAVGLCRGFRKLEKLLTRVKRGEAHRRGCGRFMPRTILLKRSTSLAEPMHKGVRWSTVLIFTSSTEPPDTPSEVLPPAMSTRRPNGDASKARRSLAGEPGTLSRWGW